MAFVNWKNAKAIEEFCRPFVFRIQINKSYVPGIIQAKVNIINNPRKILR